MFREHAAKSFTAFAHAGMLHIATDKGEVAVPLFQQMQHRLANAFRVVD